ncbi:sodium:proton exchanger [Candidatus Falkowbacteria bacterium CG10_big_fil_rev_8_21_14_0_10_43_10]|uniref:Sodium:proton exchanger n=1 Tax=Candidatus Falkowbacteria bacterium CG10_big_fil_rev_8_21_14_0_10_43_10 TaxID=1974567 RepID=A0A2H0V2I9_9BACT|nr:MAG: sodium:proton exchanger [Candidatus Falkowbacteria bacterium CG10_big_fil_rev_8_21_14_0_10_43_10]
MSVFAEISIIIAIAAAMAGVMYLLRQPLVIGHIITGLIVGPYFFNIVRTEEVINVFSELGIALLLFIVGLGLNPKLIKEVGKVSIIAGSIQIFLTSLAVYGACRLLYFSHLSAVYIAIALAFSSTIIIVKLLSDKNDLQKIYSKISLGILLVQDIVAMLALIIISAMANGRQAASLVGAIAVQGIALIILAGFLSVYVLPKLSLFFARSQEFLFLFAIAWGLGFATLFNYFGFSIEIGALAAGITLSMSPYHLEISARMKPLRDFFIILFFILLGSKMAFADIKFLIIPTVLLSLFVLLIKPFIVTAVIGLMGYKKKVSFSTGITLAQISEFSLIFIMLGVNVGQINESILSLITFIGLVTITLSTYLIMYTEKIYNLFQKPLSVFERKNAEEPAALRERYDIILFGHNRIGYDFINSFEKLKKKFIVIDYDPRIIKYLEEKNITRCYGDADDVEFLNELQLEKIKMSVSTIPEFRTNALIIKKIREKNSQAIIVSISHNIKDAENLYELGASYVILPHFLGGQYASRMISKLGFKKSEYAKEKRSHLAYLEHRKEIGHEHPANEKNR